MDFFIAHLKHLLLNESGLTKHSDHISALENAIIEI